MTSRRSSFEPLEIRRLFALDLAIGDLNVHAALRQNIHNNPDTLSGGFGYDRAQVDVSPSADNLSRIDELLA